MAVRQALGETQVVAATKSALGDAGGYAFGQGCAALECSVQHCSTPRACETQSAGRSSVTELGKVICMPECCFITSTCRSRRPVHTPRVTRGSSVARVLGASRRTPSVQAQYMAASAGRNMPTNVAMRVSKQAWRWRGWRRRRRRPARRQAAARWSARPPRCWSRTCRTPSPCRSCRCRAPPAIQELMPSHAAAMLSVHVRLWQQRFRYKNPALPEAWHSHDTPCP